MAKISAKSWLSGALALAALVIVYGAVASFGGCGRDDGRPDRPKAPPDDAAHDEATDEPVLLFSQDEVDHALFTGFEDARTWAVESADDHAVLAPTEQHVTQGRRALRLEFQALGRGKFQMRRDGKFDLSKVRRMTLDITNSGGPLEVALGLKSRRNGVFWGSPKVRLEHGLNRSVAFMLPEAPTGTYTSYNRLDASDVDRVALTFFEGKDTSGALVLDNMRLDPPPTIVKTGPTLVSVTANRAMTPRYGLSLLQNPTQGSTLAR